MFPERIRIMKGFIGGLVVVFPRLKFPLFFVRESARDLFYYQKCNPEITFQHSAVILLPTI